MNDTRKSLKPGRNNALARLHRRSVARWAPIPLRLIVGYSFKQNGLGKLSKAPEAFAIIRQNAARTYDGTICHGEVKNG